MLNNLFGVRPFVLFDADSGGGSGGGTSEKTFTQEDLNRLTGEARKDGRSTALKDLLKQFGVESADDLQALVQAARDAEAKGQSELEKLQKKITDADAALAKAKADAEQEVNSLKARILATEIKTLATQAVLDKDGKTVTRRAFRQEALEDVVLLLDKSAIEEVNPGEYKGIDKALDELAKSRPYLLTEDPKPTSKGTPKPEGKHTQKQQAATPSASSQSFRF